MPGPALDAFIYGFTLQKLSFPFEPSEYVSSATNYLPFLPVERYPHLRGMTEEIISGRHDGMHHLELGLDLLLDGLERMRAASS